ncbi:MAG: MFS transporter [Methanofollis sp.]|uniref:MFS transporter n=1 Tax=Methanofollis sp. TaxID=2052835 RepID=UPI00260326A8|nr:MFS transporter [Methanofollis sp.]MDD4254622.1 MFS transporter [Methanofollis sp.]
MKSPFDVGDPRYHLSVTAILSAVVAMVMFTEAMLAPALPAIQNEFAISGVLNSWILTIPLLVAAIISPVIGKCGDLYGKKRMILFSVIVYAAGVFASGWAPDIWVLILCRAMQGVGLGVLPLGYALIREQFPQEKVPIAIGTIAAMFGAGAFLGIFIGSWIIEHFGWRTTYHVAAPVVFLLLMATALVIIPSPRVQGAAIDRPGVATLTLFLLSIVLALTLGGQGGGMLPAVLVCAALAVAFAALFVRVERQSPDPMVDLAMIMKAPVVIAMTIGLIVTMATFMVIQTLPYLIESPISLGLSHFAVGLVMMPGALADMICGPLTGVFIRRRGERAAMLVGSVLFAAGAVCYLLLDPSMASLILAGVLFNAGMSVTLTGNTIIVVRSMRPEETGIGSSIYHTAQNMGGMIGPVIAGIFISLHVVSVPGWDIPVPTGEAFTSIFSMIVLLALFVILLARQIRDSEVTATVSGK